MTYAKLLSIGDMTPHGAPATFETRGEGRLVIMLEPEQCRYWRARLEAIIEAMKENGVVG